VDQLVAAAVDEARSLVAEGPFTAEQIDVAWTLGLGWPVHRGAPAWQAASAAAPARRS
jgi:3-hydroxyacyl-CoA dehydrogenase